MRFVLFFYLLISVAFSQSAFLEVDTISLRIGEQFNVTVKVFDTNLDSVQWPSNDELFNDFELLNVPLFQKIIDLDTFGYKTYTLTSFDTGAFLLPSIQLVTLYKDTILTNSINIQFIASPIDSTDNFFPIRPPKNIKFNMRELLVYYPILIICLFLILIFYLMRFLSKKNQSVIKVKEEQVPIDVRYLNALNSLSNKNYLNNKKYLLYYIELSDIFRGYLEEQFNVLALESSTYELKIILNKLDIKDDWIGPFLRVSDLVKFAKGVPSDKESVLFLKYHINFIKKYSIQYDDAEQNNIDDNINSFNK